MTLRQGIARIKTAGDPIPKFCAFSAFLFLCSSVLVSAQHTVSKPVGFVRVEVSPNSQNLSSLPFTPFDPSISALFTGQLTGAATELDADHLIKWDAGQQNYEFAFKGLNGSWLDTNGVGSTLTFSSGEGFWIENRQTNAQSVYLTGTVILDATHPVSFFPGLNTFAYPFSSRIALNETMLAEDGAFGGLSLTNADVITDPSLSPRQFWLLDDTNSPLHGLWLDQDNLLANEFLGLGRGYWYERIYSNLFVWSENRPYADLFPGDDDPPRVTAMTLNAAGDEMTLGIATHGTTNETLEIYYQDLSLTNAFDSSKGWKVATTDLPTLGQTHVTWTDAGELITDNRSLITDVFARFYLVARGDIDTDGDGIPDGREVFVYGSDPLTNEVTVFTSSTVIEATNRLYDGHTLVINGTTLTIDGFHGFANLILTNGAVVRHSTGYADGMVLDVNGKVVVEAGSRIDVSARGKGPSSSMTGRSGGRMAVGGKVFPAVRTRPMGITWRRRSWAREGKAVRPHEEVGQFE